MAKTALRRPLLRYHGGKWMLAPWIISHLPAHRVYVEPFGGAASVLIRKPRSWSEVYNDLDGELVNLFRVVRDRGPELAQALHLTPFSRSEYYDVAMEVSEDPLENARRLVIRSFMGFGSDAFNPERRSGFRAKSHRSGTTPAHDWAAYPPALMGIVERLRGIVLENKDAREVMAQQDEPGTLHYCDPPYVWDTRSVSAHSPVCYRHEMADSDHEDLAKFLKGLAGMVVVSGYDCPLYQDLYGGWRSVRKEALADGARKRTEVLWLSPSVPAEATLF